RHGAVSLVLCSRSPAPRVLPSLPTRRSSDLHGDGNALTIFCDVQRFERIDQGGGRSEGVGLTVDLNFHGVTSRRNEREWPQRWEDRKSTRLNSSHVSISYAVFCSTKKRQKGG